MNHNRGPAPPKFGTFTCSDMFGSKDMICGDKWQVVDIFGAVEELHNLSAKEMNKLLRDSQHLFTLRLRTGRGSSIRVDLERVVLGLPLHLLACLASRGVDPQWRYLLRGVRLLHSLSDLALRHPKLEQIFLQEVKIREQILDFIVYMLITLATPEQEGRLGSSFTIVHAALVACTLHLLPAFVAAEWSDVVPVLLEHPKVDIFMDVAFDAVRRDIGLLQSKLRVLNSKLVSNKVTISVAECMAQVIAQQCEASLQVLQSLCQPQSFRDKLLNHKELCGNGGILRLALAVLKLQLPMLLAESKYLSSLVSRLKSKSLAMMVKFCETESVSFLDEVAADVRSMNMAEMVVEEVLEIVRKALTEEPRDLHAVEEDENEIPSGLLHIHAMRLADIFSDDSNFRNLVMDHIAPDLAKVLAASPIVFSSGWCSSSIPDVNIKPASDALLIYDPFRASGAAMQSFKIPSSSAARGSGSSALMPDESSGCSLSAGHMHFASYSQERSSLFVKILANLHCFNAEICPADEKDRFLNLFIECLMAGPLTPGNSAFFLSTVQTAVRVCENLFVLLDHVSSLSTEVVSDEDLQLVSTFYFALHEAICPSAVPEVSMQEDPVVAYVRDAHEQKRRVLLAQWQRSERWQRIHHQPETSDREQSNAGSSINKSTKSSSSQPGFENDASQLSEEEESFAHFADRITREAQGPEGDETIQPSKWENIHFLERKTTDLGWIEATEVTVTQEQMDGAVERDVPDKGTAEEADVAEVSGLKGDADIAKAMESGEYDTEVATDYEVARNVESHLAGNLQVRSENEEMISTRQENLKFEEDFHPDKDNDFKFEMKVKDVEINEAADPGVQDFQTCMDSNQFEEENAEAGPASSRIDTGIRIVVENRQQSPLSGVELTQAWGVEENSQTIGSCTVQSITSGVASEEIQLKKRKRNLMNDQQMAVMETALQTEPEMHKYPDLIMQWTDKLNTMGPEISYQQLKNWINNRKAWALEENSQAIGTCTIQSITSGVACEELQPKKRKRNIMNDQQMAVMETALQTEPEMQKYPDLIMQWTDKLNTMGPEISYQQLKNWINNRKARLARQARDTRGAEDEVQLSVHDREVISSLKAAVQVKPAPGSNADSGSSNDPKGAICLDNNSRDSGSTIQIRKPSISIS